MKNILIIEDSAALAAAIASFIKEFVPGSIINFAVDKEEALALLKQKNFCLITLDGRLLNNDHGRDVLREMNEEQISKTVVCSFEMDFLTECAKKKIDCLHKDSNLLEGFEKILRKKELMN